MTAIDPRAVLAGISGGRVLDVATGTGGFARFLVDGLADYEEIVGIDSNADRGSAFAATFDGHAGISFIEMDAHHLAFPDASFDTVCVSNSLHHFADPAPVLAEMLRVLRRGGHMIVNEMYRDGQTDEQMTHVLLHHWWAAVNMIGGEVHRETYRRAELVGILGNLALVDLRIIDLVDADEDPHDPEMVEELDAAIDRHLGLADGHPELLARGKVLRERLHEVGARGATQLLAIGRR
jgi:SAM-dependent methyltransferase